MFYCHRLLSQSSQLSSETCRFGYHLLEETELDDCIWNWFYIYIYIFLYGTKLKSFSRCSQMPRLSVLTLLYVKQVFLWSAFLNMGINTPDGVPHGTHLVIGHNVDLNLWPSVWQVWIQLLIPRLFGKALWKRSREFDSLLGANNFLMVGTYL